MVSVMDLGTAACRENCSITPGPEFTYCALMSVSLGSSGFGFDVVKMMDNGPLVYTWAGGAGGVGTDATGGAGAVPASFIKSNSEPVDVACGALVIGDALPMRSSKSTCADGAATAAAGDPCMGGARFMNGSAPPALGEGTTGEDIKSPKISTGAATVFLATGVVETAMSAPLIRSASASAEDVRGWLLAAGTPPPSISPSKSTACAAFAGVTDAGVVSPLSKSLSKSTPLAFALDGV
mmetsp:Transcript_970/g.3068  ORF Transcript_970/g.3068 Transcript_970/m.3068 type:complete len:238 (+) Transcript_970:182-895(+)